MGLAAAGTHSGAGGLAGGGDLARLAAMFLLIHAAAVAALAAYAAKLGPDGLAVVVAALVLIVGVLGFSGDLGIVAFTGRHLTPGLAPAGGLLLVLGWVIVAAAPWIGKRRA